MQRQLIRLSVALCVLFTAAHASISGKTVVMSGATNARPRVFVFGGNGFIGSSTVELLHKLGYNITSLNRGNKYWGWDESEYATVIKCDRTRGLRSCTELQKHLETAGEYDAIIDFSGYGPQEVDDAVSFFRGKFKLYIFMSTDSVYEVSVRKASEQAGSKETDAIRPSDARERDTLNQLDRYGDLKLQCEELLQNRSKEYQFAFVALRLPDVFGPRDTTLRWWFYQSWVGLSYFYVNKIDLPKWIENHRVSFVYVHDVARVINILLDNTQAESYLMRAARDSRSIIEAYNVGFQQSVTMTQLLLEMAEIIGIPNNTITFNTVNESRRFYPRFFPSVKRGPIDVSKAMRELFFTPTPWQKAVRETVEFYQEAIISDDRKTEREQLLRLLKETEIIERDQELLKYASYLKYGHVKDEL